MKKLLLAVAVFAGGFAVAQPAGKDTTANMEYRAFATKINDLVHTKLDARFDYSKSYLNGKVWITLQPHFYPTDSLRLDAKGMTIHKVELVQNGSNIPLKYTYDSLFLNIQLNRTYTSKDKYVVFIDYTARPDEFKSKGSVAITDAKGLYFINPRGEEKNKPTQIWTQGETEATSVWIPTIDRPNQKTTNEFILTVPAKYVTLSNGRLASQKKNADGTRTDTWRMELPHSPYLFFIGVGDWAVVKDAYKGKEVNYYVDKEYEKVARKIFGLTPEMMKFFAERITGVEYPWVKYSQVVGRDYVSGAMENTTATLHQESAQQNARELVDGNEWESTIAHELFHQWFGDYVTAESWSNLTVNESFADYSQLLWLQHKYGQDEAGYENFNEMSQYLSGRDDRAKNLVRFYYDDKEDMFDLVSYQKGGRILHMLRTYVGDSAFFASLHKYLTTNKFGNGSAHKLRLAFEEVTGKDLNWFFNQWYFGSGHPTLDIKHAYDAQNKLVKVYINQVQPGGKLFTLPMAIDVYTGSRKTRYNVWVEHKADTFSFPSPTNPDLVNVDGDRTTLMERKETKTLEEAIHQYNYAGTFLDRKDALDVAVKTLQGDGSGKPGAAAAYGLLVKALSDPYYRLREKALAGFGNATLDASTIAKMEAMAKTDPKTTVRAAAIDQLGKLKNASYKDFFMKSTRDSSYSIAGAALEALAEIDGKEAFGIVNQLKTDDNRGRLVIAITDVTIQYGDETAFDFVYEKYSEMPLTLAKVSMSYSVADFMIKVTNKENFKKGVDQIAETRDAIPGAAKPRYDPIFDAMLKKIADEKDKAGSKDLADYARSKMTKK